MLVKQPFFVGGIDNVEEAKGSAFGAAGMFFFTFLASIIYLIRDSRRVSDIRVVEERGGGGGSTSGSVHSSSSRQESFALHRVRSSGSLTRRVRGDTAQTRGGEYGKVSVFEDYDQSEEQLEPLQHRGGYLS